MKNALNRYVKKAEIIISAGVVVVLALCSGIVFARQQNLADAAKTQIELGAPSIYLIPINATAAAGSQATLTLPAPPPGLYNYLCKLEFSASQNGTATANTNATFTTTNFNSWSWKWSLAATANLTYEHTFDMGTPTTGCAKSTAPGTATTFTTNPTTFTNTAINFSAQYYQGK